MGKQWKQWQTSIFLYSKIMADDDCSCEIKWHLFLGRKAMTNLDCMLKSKTFLCQQSSIESELCFVCLFVCFVFVVFLVVMCRCKLGHKGGWALRNWYFWTEFLEKPLVSHLGCKEIKPVNPKGNQSWKVTGETDAEADMKSQLIGKHSGSGKDWSRRMGW